MVSHSFFCGELILAGHMGTLRDYPSPLEVNHQKNFYLIERATLTLYDLSCGKEPYDSL